MQSTLFGCIEAAPAPHLAQSISAPAGTTRLHVHAHSIVYGSDKYVGSAADDAVAVFVGGRPQWRGSAATLVSVAQSLLAAYRDTGSRALTNINNGFVAAIIDLGQREVHLAIDRIGRCALAYALLPSGGLCFGTDARWVANTLAQAVSGAVRLNPQALFDYSFFHEVPSAQTVFKSVHKLRPASRAHWHAGKIETATYWQPTFSTRSDTSFADFKEQLFASLTAGVQAAEPDAATASFLSGGIDSSTVTGLLAKLRGKGAPAYTIGFEQAGYDETEYARIAAKHFGADLRVHYVTTADVERGIGEIAALYDEPFGNSSAVPSLMCARIAKSDGIAHMLAGDGGDELFAGNTRYAKQRIFEVYARMPQAMRALTERLFLSGSPLIAKTPLRKVSSYVQQARIPLPDRVESYNFLLRENIARIFEPEFLAQTDTNHPFVSMREQYWGVEDAATLDRMLYLDWKFTLADNDLRKVRSTCNHAGVEVSFPWLDDGVLEFSARLPADQKMRGTKLRFFIKRALADFLPHATLVKSKHGFGLPFGQWLKTSASLQSRVYDLLAALRERGIFRREFLDHLIEEHRTGHAAYYGTMVWVLAMLEAWLQANPAARL